MQHDANAKARGLFESNLAVIFGAIRLVVARRRVRLDDGEEFHSYTMLRLMKNDCACLRSFRGQSSLRTYLVRVIDRYYLDFQVQRWGRWRSSARAKSLGQAAICLERLLYRERLSLSEAVTTMRVNLRATQSEEQLRTLSTQLPARVQRKPLDETVLVNMPAPRAEERVLLRYDRNRAQRQARRALATALRKLTQEERQMLRLRFLEGWSVPEVATALGLPAKPLYRRIQQTLRRLRGWLEGQGLTWDEVGMLAGWKEADLGMEQGLLTPEPQRVASA